MAEDDPLFGIAPLFNNSDVAQVWVGYGVADVSPVPNSRDVALDADLVITMSGTLSQTTVTTQTLFVHGGFRGRLDGAIGFSNAAGYSQTIYAPDGNFYPGELIQASVTTGTLDSDGVPIVLPHVWSFRAETLDGSGSFRDSGNRLGDDSSSDMALGDVDGDGDLDAVVVNYNQDDRVWLNDGNSNFSENSNTLGSWYSGAVALGDVDGDGDLDAFIGNPTGGSDTVWLNDGDGAFSDSGNRLGNSYSYDVALGDVDGDGDLDAYVVNDNDSDVVWLNDGDGNFSAGDYMGSDSWGRAVALGDVDGDGDLDAFVVNAVDPSQVWLNDGSGEFYDSRNDLGSSYSKDVALGDLDGDGDLDAFVVNSVGQADKVWLNDGSGNFSESDNNLGDSWNLTVDLGDLDGDGDLDAFVGSDGYNTDNKVWLNDGSGNFEAGSDVPSSSYSSGVALGDVDGDGDLDAFVANSGDANEVWLNRNGADLAIVKSLDTTPSAPGQAVQGQPITYTLAFVNNGPEPATGVVITDRIPVSVTSISYQPSTVNVTATGSISYVWNVQDLAPGQGGIITITGLVSSTLPDGHIFGNSAVLTSAVEDDVPTNNTSSVDVIISPLHIITTNPPFLALGVPLTTTVNATFDADVDTGTVASTTFVVHGMMGGLVTGTFSYDSPSRTLTLTPSRAFHTGEIVRTSATGGIFSASGAPLIPYQWEFTAGQITNRCVAGFSNVNAGLTGVSVSSAVWGDYDDDGDLDVLLTGSTGTSRVSRVYRNDGDTFTDIGAGLIDVYYSSVAWGDYDNDGDLDILLTGSDYYGPTSIARVYRNDGDDTFTDINAGLTGVSDSSAVAWGDYDNDGDLDILLTGYNYGSSTSIAKVYRNDEGSTFTDINAGLSGVSRSSVAWGDYDNDGDLDILLTGYDGSDVIAQVYRNDGENTFSDIGANLTGVLYGSVAWGDYDNDGDLDILLTGSTGTSRVSRLYRNEGEGTFNNINAGLISVESSSVAWGDYDNDGDLDILLTGNDGSTSIAQVYRNNGNGTFGDANVDLTGVNYGSVAWGDYDNDGDLDILLTGSYVSQVYRNDDCGSDLSIVKAVTPQFAVPGDTVTYTLDFFNGGMLTATHVVITDHIPVSVTVNSVVSSGIAITGTGASPAYVWSVGDLSPGDGGVITITGVLSDPLPSGTFTNTAVITTTTVDAIPNNNSDLADITIDAEPPAAPTLLSPTNGAVISDTTPTLTWNPGADAAGYLLNFDGAVGDVGNATFSTTGILADAAYTWTVAAYDALGNTSAYTDTWGFTVDTVPPGTTITGNPPDPSTSADATFEFTGNDPDGSGVASFECQLDGGGWITCISPQSYLGLSDGSHTFEVRATDYAGNTDATPASYTWTIATGTPTLRVFKGVGTGGLSQVPLNSIVTYTIVISNSGDGVAANVVMTDPLPTAVSFGTQSEGTLLVPLPGNVYRWGPHDVAVHTAYTITFTANVTDNGDFVGDTITNTAHVAADNTAPNSDDAIFTIAGDFYIYLPAVLRNY